MAERLKAMNISDDKPQDREEMIEAQPGVFIPYRLYMLDQQIIGEHKRRMAEMVARIAENLRRREGEG